MTTFQPRPYQAEAMEFLQVRQRAMLALDPGLGKTASCLAALTPEHLPALVMAPPLVAETTWANEISKWGFDLRTAYATGKKREATLNDPDLDVVTLSMSQVGSIQGNLSRFRTVIIDEAHNWKSPSGVRFKATRRLTRDTPNVWALTGTPMPNGLLDLWAPMYLVDRGDALGTSMSQYKTRYFTPGKRLPNGVMTDWRPNPGAQTAIYRALEHRVMSLTTSDRVTLPELVDNPVMLDLPRSAANLYKKLQQDMIVRMDLLGVGQPGQPPLTASTAAVLSARLRQVASGTAYPDAEERLDDPTAYHVIHDRKVEELRRIVEEASTPVLCWVWFKSDMDRLLREFPQAERMKGADTQKRWNRGKIPLLIANPASAGEGLNLQDAGCGEMVFFTEPWSHKDNKQAVGRLHRPGAKTTLVVHRLRMRGTVDEKVGAALSEKRSVEDALMEHLELTPRQKAA